MEKRSHLQQYDISAHSTIFTSLLYVRGTYFVFGFGLRVTYCYSRYLASANRFATMWRRVRAKGPVPVFLLLVLLFFLFVCLFVCLFMFVCVCVFSS